MLSIVSLSDRVNCGTEDKLSRVLTGSDVEAAGVGACAGVGAGEGAGAGVGSQ